MELDEIEAREDFRIHLVAKDPNEVVGMPYEASNCPAANWLSERTGHRCSVVPNDFWEEWLDYATLTYVRREVPRWLSEFAIAVDHSGEAHITAKHALTILDDIPR